MYLWKRWKTDFEKVSTRDSGFSEEARDTANLALKHLAQTETQQTKNSTTSIIATLSLRVIADDSANNIEVEEV